MKDGSMAKAKDDDVLGPFTIEAGTTRNDDVVIQCIPGRRKLRGRISSQNGVYIESTDSYEVPRDQAIGLSGLPVIPGMTLTVDPDSGDWTIDDPLNHNPGLCDKITKWMREHSVYRSNTPIRGVESVSGNLDIHSRKTLCRELFHLVGANEAAVVEGVLPTMKQIEEMPGNFLLNPGSTITNTQPRYEKDWDSFLRELNRVGGA